MKEDTKRLMRAYLEIYKEFFKVYLETRWEDRTFPEGALVECVELFEIAWNDSIFGELLREEVMEEYKGILEREQVKKEIEEEAEAGEAMII